MHFTLYKTTLPETRITKHSHAVEMDQLKAIYINNPGINDFILLHTEGLSPCMCIIFYGVYKQQNFMAMLHWSGFAVNETSEDFDADYFGEWMCDITEQLDKLSDDDCDEGEIITITGIFNVGGQTKQVNKNGELICSGTASEVESLQRFVGFHRNCTNHDYSYHIDKNINFIYNNFITRGDSEAINVYATGSGNVFWCFDRLTYQSMLLLSGKNYSHKRACTEIFSDHENKVSLK